MLSLPSGRWLDLSRPGIVGVLNVTPDSFSDGGRFIDPCRAAEHAAAMAAQGAVMIDIGGESTRPGSKPVGAAEQIQRVVPVIRAIRAHEQAAAAVNAHSPAASGAQGVVISVDTSLGEVASAALAAGADVINDVWAGRDPRNASGVSTFEVAAQAEVPIVLMHMLGEPGTMQQAPSYKDVVAQVGDFLEARIQAAAAAGVAQANILLDPGVGFGKTLTHNLELLAGLPALVKRFVAVGPTGEAPTGDAAHTGGVGQGIEAGQGVAGGVGVAGVLVGASRKRFLRVVGRTDEREHDSLQTTGPDTTHEELLGGTCAVTVIAAQSGACLIRCHDVAANTRALAVAQAIGVH